MNSTKLIQTLENIVEEDCKKKSNFFGYRAWETHIKIVIKLSKQLAEVLGADKEIVIIAAILHDYANILDKDNEPKHHIIGSNIARELLKSYNYDEKKTDLVCKAIYSHRGSTNIERLSNEEICLASADAMANIDQIPSLLHMVYVNKGMSVSEGAKIVIAKLNRAWNKLCPEAKEMIRDKYEAAKVLLDEYL